MSDEATKKFLEKHKPLKPEDVRKSLADAETSRTNYSKNIEEIESNLTAFFQKEDPIIEPGTGKVLGWIRQTSIRELQERTKEFESALEGKTEKEAQELLDNDPNLKYKQYDLMASLITKPKHDAKWWADNATIDFIKLFEATWQSIMTRDVEAARFLPEQTTGSG